MHENSRSFRSSFLVLFLLDLALYNNVPDQLSDLIIVFKYNI